MKSKRWHELTDAEKAQRLTAGRDNRSFAERAEAASRQVEEDVSENETYEEFCARKDREQVDEDEQREVEASQLEDWKSWRRS